MFSFLIFYVSIIFQRCIRTIAICINGSILNRVIVIYGNPTIFLIGNAFIRRSVFWIILRMFFRRSATMPSKSVKQARLMAAAAHAVRTPKRWRFFFMNEAGATVVITVDEKLAKKPGDIVEHGDGHHEQQHRNTAALQALHPEIRRAFSRSQSRSFSASRLSCCFFPLARPISALIRPFWKCRSTGISV